MAISRLSSPCDNNLYHECAIIHISYIFNLIFNLILNVKKAFSNEVQGGIFKVRMGEQLNDLNSLLLFQKFQGE